MAITPHPVNSVDFLYLLPGFFAAMPEEGSPSFKDFVAQFEELFEGLQAAIAGDALTLTYRGVSGKNPAEDYPSSSGSYPLPVELFAIGRLGYPKNTPVFIPGNPDTTLLAEAIDAGPGERDLILVKDRNFWKYLQPGSKFILRGSSGLAGLSSIQETPPTAFHDLGEKDKLAYLAYLASWIGLPVRADKLVSWNRRFLREAINLDNDPNTQRSTLPGIREMLKAWHKGEIVAEETLVTDLIAPHNGGDTVFRIGDSRIGIDMLFGEGAPRHFHVRLTADPDDVSMRDPTKLHAMDTAARLLLDREKPANTEYTLHIHASTMQLAPNARIAPYANSKAWEGLIDAEEELLSVQDTNTYARIGVTTLLWND
ncbi:MAG: hypothetical protein FWH28_06440 [Clostridiales bacterium]|nr:hypothetical protein [Clostridiales bacterium]